MNNLAKGLGVRFFREIATPGGACVCIPTGRNFDLPARAGEPQGRAGRRSDEMLGFHETEAHAAGGACLLVADIVDKVANDRSEAARVT